MPAILLWPPLRAMPDLSPRLFALALSAIVVLGMVADVHAADSASSPRDDALAYFQNLPASNPYRAALLRYQTLPAADREALKTWADGRGENEPPPALSAEQARVAAELSAAIIAASGAPATARSDWPLMANPDDPENPAAVTLPGVGTLRTLARLTIAGAASLPADEACAVYAAAAQLGRQQRSGATLIEQLTGIAIENIAQAEAAKRLGELDAAGLNRLASLWSALTPPPANAKAVAGERDEFFLPILEHVLAPGLRALLADPKAGTADEPASPDAGFTRDLRLCGLVSLGEGSHRVILENTRNGESFSLEPGRTVDGIELVSLDYEKRLAVLRRGAREAVVLLESKRIIERANPARTFRETFKSFDLFQGEGSGEKSMQKVLVRARNHPEGVDGYLRDLRAEYQAGIDRQLRLADSPQAPAADEAAPGASDPFIAMTTPTIGRVIRTMNNAATQSSMLQAAIRHRMIQIGAEPTGDVQLDPWGEGNAGFVTTPTPDGGFTLRSRYEVSPGRPLTYKFAASDAGFVRAK